MCTELPTKDAMKDWEETPLFQIRLAFKQMFWAGSGKSAKKGRYGVVSLETMASCWDDETESAVVAFEGELDQRSLRSTFLTSVQKKETITELTAALQILLRATGAHTESVTTLIGLFDSEASFEEKATALEVHGQKVVEAIEIARAMKAVKTPALGGVTRWGFDKITSVEFLSTQLPTVAAFALDSIERQKKPPQSLVELRGESIA